MAASSAEAGLLVGKVVAFAGKLACMTRAEAAKLVRSRGGAVAPTVNSRTSIVVVGQEGWPLQRNGRLTVKLRKVQRMQERGNEVAIYREEEFLRKLGLDPAENVRRLYTASQLANLLGVARDRLKSWLRNDLVQPSQSVDGVDYFDYAQVVGIKSLAELVRAGVKVDAIRRSLLQLQRWLPDVDDPLGKLTILQQAGELGVRYDDCLVEPTGQKVFEFDDPVPPVPLSIPAPATQDWFARACELEDAGRLVEAADAYRQALLANGADRDTVFNLANVLYALNQKLAALERYYQVLEFDKTFARAWANIGVILSEWQRPGDAAAAFRMALQVDAHCLEARYNLADLLQSTGRRREAMEHWREYLKYDAQSPWGKFAQEQLKRG
jgi:tetratricopeptide (TPR) repeat protein